MKQFFDLLLEKARIKPKPTPDPTAPRYGEFMDRVFAVAIDLVLLYFLLFPLFVWIQTKVYAHVDWGLLSTIEKDSATSLRDTFKMLVDAHYIGLWLLNTLIQVIVIGIVMVSCQLHFGTTPGKYLLGLKVVDAETHAPPKSWQYILRFVAYLASALPLMIGMFWISFNKERRGWHDYIAHTVVLNTRPHGWYWQQIKKGIKWMAPETAEQIYSANKWGMFIIAWVLAFSAYTFLSLRIDPTLKDYDWYNASAKAWFYHILSPYGSMFVFVFLVFAGSTYLFSIIQYKNLKPQLKVFYTCLKITCVIAAALTFGHQYAS